MATTAGAAERLVDALVGLVRALSEGRGRKQRKRPEQRCRREAGESEEAV